MPRERRIRAKQGNRKADQTVLSVFRERPGFSTSNMRSPYYGYLPIDGSRVVTDEQFHPGKVVVIDTERLYMFNKATETVTAILDLDRITCAEDLQWVKQRIREAL